MNAYPSSGVNASFTTRPRRGTAPGGALVSSTHPAPPSRSTRSPSLCWPQLAGLDPPFLTFPPHSFPPPRLPAQRAPPPAPKPLPSAASTRTAVAASLTDLRSALADPSVSSVSLRAHVALDGRPLALSGPGRSLTIASSPAHCAAAAPPAAAPALLPGVPPSLCVLDARGLSRHFLVSDGARRPCSSFPGGAASHPAPVPEQTQESSALTCLRPTKNPFPVVTQGRPSPWTPSPSSAGPPPRGGPPSPSAAPPSQPAAAPLPTARPSATAAPSSPPTAAA